jgi:hypothetical protein
MTERRGTVAPGADRIVGALKKAGVKEVDDVREVRSPGLETVRLPEPQISKMLQPSRLLESITLTLNTMSSH